MPDESLEEAVQSTYVFGEFNMGAGVKRQILGFPYLEHRAVEDDSDPSAGLDKFQLGLKICLLPGLIDIPKLKDAFTSSTLVLELHREDVYKRAFHTRNVEEYMRMTHAEKPAVEAPVETKKGAKAAPPPAAKKGAAPEPVGLPKVEVTAMTDADRFLLGCIQRALGASRQIRPHGTVRYRLEQLLSSSNDLLTRFARMRHGGAPTAGDDTVVVKEDLLLEVRLEKPSKPEKWDLPADISLKSALTRAKEEQQSKLDGTLALNGTLPALGGTLGSTLGATAKSRVILSKPAPRHEMFLSNGTAMEMTASLLRALIEPAKVGEYIAQHCVLSIVALRFFVFHTDLKPTPPLAQKNIKVPATAMPEIPLSDMELQKKLAVTPFTRLLVLFKYLDDDTLRAIAAGLNAVNSSALPDIQGTLRSYSFSEAELAAAKDAKLDVITGFMIIDDDMRLVVLEGLAAPGKGMQRMFTEFLPRVKQNDDQLKIVCNPEVLFPDRIYPEFGPDIRRIRIRDKLKKLAKRPEIYNRKQVEEICFNAVDCIMTLRRAQDMDSTKKLDMYPTAESLNKLELLYGEAITRPDMDGTLRDAFKENFEKTKLATEKRRASSPIVPATPPTDADGTLRGSPTRAAREAYKPTDCRNPGFEIHLRTRPVHRVDLLAETKELRAQAWEGMLRRREHREEEYHSNLRSVLGEEAYEKSMAAGGPKIFLYSQQSKNFKAQAFNVLRDRVAQDKNATYTFSQDFVSQTVCVVDEDQLVKNAKAESKAAMLTAKGFQYPKPKTRAELLLHPQRPSEARIEELKEPFRDILDVRPGADSETRDPTLRALEKGFKTQIPSDGLFGALKPVTFERPFELKLVGDRTKLPRGLLTGGTEPDPAAFRSVHLGGENQARIIQEAADQEKREWAAKVVVDTLSVQVGGFKVRDKPIQMNRTQDILHDEPKREELKHLRTRVSHLGNDWGYSVAPLSILNSEQYVPNQAANALMRTTNPDKFITSTMLLASQAQAKETARKKHGASSASLASTTDSDYSADEKEGRTGTQKPLDFSRYIHKDTFNPKLVSAIARRKHPPQDRNSEECKGPKWQGAESK